MPSSVGSALFIFAAFLLTISTIAGVALAGFALLWEVFLFGVAGFRGVG